jgi:hypothetical protein
MILGMSNAITAIDAIVMGNVGTVVTAAAITTGNVPLDNGMLNSHILSPLDSLRSDIGIGKQASVGIAIPVEDCVHYLSFYTGYVNWVCVSTSFKCRSQPTCILALSAYTTINFPQRQAIAIAVPTLLIAVM